jgi:hypothetical protein
MEKINAIKELNIPKKGVPEQLYQLKIKLEGISPPIWRRIVLSSYTYFSELHDLIQKYFSWDGYHLHEFYFPHPAGKRNRIYIKGIIDWEEDFGIDHYHFLANEIRLCDVLSKTRKRAYYVYDFGDNWRHVIILEKIFPYDDRFVGPICVGGRRAGPLEDSGGPSGFREKLKTIKQPTHRNFEEILNWLGDDYNAEQVNEILIKLSPKKLEKIFGPSL